MLLAKKRLFLSILSKDQRTLSSTVTKANLADLLGGMGAVVGKISEETPKYTVIDSGTGYEVREYDPILVAQVGGMDGELRSKGTSEAFFQLARYIGVFNKPENVAGGKGEKIAMTAPVLMEGEKIAMTAPVLLEGAEEQKPEKIAMTAPVLMEPSGAAGEAAASSSGSGMVMQFVLPSKYTMETIPKPTNPNVVLKEIPKRKMGAVTFSGNASPNNSKPREEALSKALTEAGYRITGKPIFAGYNPPFTLPWFRKNEILIPVESPAASET